MTVERRSDVDLNTWLDAADAGYDSRQVPLQVQPKRQEIRRHQNAGGATVTQPAHRFGKIRSALFEESRLDQIESTFARDLPGDGAYRVVRRFHTRSVREYGEPGLQALPCT